jgi:DNA-binding NarL/FixJ family response regulator
VLILTTFDLDEYVYRALRAGASGFVLKDDPPAAEIGRELFISDTTVKTHVTRLLQKLKLRDRAQAIVLAYQTGMFEPTVDG